MARGGVGLVGLLLVAVGIASCAGASDDDAVAVPESSPTSAVAEPLDVEPASTSTTVPSAEFSDGPLGDVCGDTIVVQTSDLPHVGVGPLYALLGATPDVDVDAQVASGAITRADGTVEDVTLELRSGGPAVGFRSPIVVMADDDTIQLAVVSTAVAVRDRSVLATHAIASLTDRSRDALIIDPATYPDATDVAALGESGVEIRHVTDAPVIAYLEAAGALASEQLVSGSDGLPASFVSAEGTVAQQGDLTIEPALLPSLPQWGRPVTALPASEAGWASLDDMVVVDAADRLADECIGRLARIVQESIVAYVAAPAATNGVMSDLLTRFNPLSRLTPELFDLGTQLAIDAGVFDTTRDDPPGAMSTDGLGEFIEELAPVLGVDAVEVEELVDSRYLDPTITR